jgi:Icc-related predicted phosphoesterase
MNGKIIKKFNAEEGKINVSFPIKVSNTCWFAVRACAHNRFPNAKHKLKAHTSPIYVQFGNKTIIPPKEDIQYFLRWLDKCKTFGEKWSKMKNDKTKTRLEKYLKLVDEAQQVYQELLTKPRTWEKDTEEPLLTLFHCSDPHASPKRPVHNKNLLKAIDYINKTKPDIVVFTGDLGESAKEEDLRLFESCMKKISCPVFCVPGNHDINNKKGIPPEVSPESISLYNKIFKTDYWHKKVKEKIHFIGINSVIINSALPREKEQWDWLIKELDSIPNDNIIILCSHYPLFIKDVQNGSYFLIDSPGRERLIKLIEKYTIPTISIATR